MAPSLNYSLNELYEDRLLRVEDSIKELSVDVGKLQVGLENLQGSFKESFNSIDSKLDQIIKVETTDATETQETKSKIALMWASSLGDVLKAVGLALAGAITTAIGYYFASK